ncbi:MAG: hypothetical protein H0W37_09555 [Pseudonocardiales bacterium]|nr:hypothetical protein [Pseudonocardiales bacterium]
MNYAVTARDYFGQEVLTTTTATTAVADFPSEKCYTPLSIDVYAVTRSPDGSPVAGALGTVKRLFRI